MCAPGTHTAWRGLHEDGCSCTLFMLRPRGADMSMHTPRAKVVRVPQRGLLLRSELDLADDAEAWPTLRAARRRAEALDEGQRRQQQEEKEEAGRSAIAGVSAEQEEAMAGLLLQSVATGGGADEGAAGLAEGEGTSEDARGEGGAQPEDGQRARTSCELRALHLLTPWAEVQKPEDAGTPTPLCMSLGARGRLHCAACCVWRPRDLLSKAARVETRPQATATLRPPTAPGRPHPADAGLPSGLGRSTLAA